ncbi:hypothetical protein BJ508DRAFT_323837 [Ascobolus immersus RN42]|uniref:Uncharacterized protein n=1 Tax=Ascobolus immersus RN42 TaxID=1160509 RepID=A0A3N4IDJ4_ASCIM|nr:hypothetical protein BJ508DRAFT_323837 [Ascobolus immersus RN42]
MNLSFPASNLRNLLERDALNMEDKRPNNPNHQLHPVPEVKEFLTGHHRIHQKLGDCCKVRSTNAISQGGPPVQREELQDNAVFELLGCTPAAGRGVFHLDRLATAKDNLGRGHSVDSSSDEPKDSPHLRAFQILTKDRKVTKCPNRLGSYLEDVIGLRWEDPIAVDAAYDVEGFSGYVVVCPEGVYEIVEMLPDIRLLGRYDVVVDGEWREE